MKKGIDLSSHFSNARVCVVGDVMLDQYWHGDTTRISPEAPVPVVKIHRSEDRAGGAANVALNIAHLGAQVHLVGIIGEDPAGQILKKILQKEKVHCEFVESSQYPTVTKLRVMGRNQQLIRLDFEQPLKDIAHQIEEKLHSILDNIDVLILSDYAKGALTHIQALVDLAKSKNIPVLVDPKNEDLTHYQGVDLMTPNLKEFKACVGNCDLEHELVEKGQQLLETMQLPSILITRGSHGMTLLEKGQAPYHIPALAKEVYDITGAGDTVIAVMGVCMAAKLPLQQCADYANLAASISVGKMGTATISCDELITAKEQNTDSTSESCMTTETELMYLVAKAKNRGERIVMTNGCFDILHQGHIQYLEQAKALGTKLVVAVNDDESVKRLKGDTRPINSLSARMQLLGALKCVDWVVPFSEDTPKRVISELLPDILVKGGDYKVEEIAGAKEVISHGGLVKILDFVDGFSTTNTLDKLSKTSANKEAV